MISKPWKKLVDWCGWYKRYTAKRMARIMFLIVVGTIVFWITIVSLVEAPWLAAVVLVPLVLAFFSWLFSPDTDP